MDCDPAAQEIEEATASNPSSHAVDERGHPGWRVTLSVMWVAQLFCIMGFSFVMPFIPFFVRELGVTEKMLPIWAGLIGTGAGIAMSIMGPIWGYVADRYGRKLMVMRAMLGGSVILALMGFAQNVYQLLVLRMLQGSITGTVPASIALVSSVVPKRQLGFSLGLMQMAVFTGGSIGPFVGGLVADSFGYRIPFGVTGALLLTGGILVLFGARERFERPAQEEGRSSSSLRAIFEAPGVLVLLAVYFMMNFSMSFVAPIFPLFVEEVVGQTAGAATETGILIAATGVAAAVSSVSIGRISDRLGHRRVLIGCTTIAALLCFPHYPAQSLSQLLVLRILFGLGAGGMVPAMNALIANTIPRANIGQAYGFTTTASALGFATGPAVGGWIASMVGYRVPFLIVGGLVILVTFAQRRWLPRPASE